MYSWREGGYCQGLRLSCVERHTLKEVAAFYWKLIHEALMSKLVQRFTPDLADETRDNCEILRDTSLSQESRAAARAALQNDAGPESLFTTIFSQTDASDMADY